MNKKENDLVKESLTLLDKHRKLEARYTALFTLNQLAIDCADLNVFFNQVHHAISAIMPANNFYIAMYDQGAATIDFVYDIDEKDSYLPGPMPYKDLEGSMTRYVIESARPLLATPERVAELTKQKKIKQIGTKGIDWLGIPLMSDGFVIGIMAVQSYNETIRYQEHDLEMLTFTAQHVVNAMMRLQDRDRLQKAVDARTRELLGQIREREKSERLQESLYRISELTNDTSLDIDKFYSMVHNIIGQLINAKNFFIAKYDQEEELLSFVYHSDQRNLETNCDFAPRKLSKRYTELVIKQGKALLLTNDEMTALYQAGKTITPPEDTQSWLGVPLIQEDAVIGAMVIQSYQSNVIFTEQDQELLKFVSQHVSTAIKRREVADIERETHEMLEHQVKLRTVALEEEIKQRKVAEAKLKYAATHDSLTGLPNRSIFVDLLNHAIACNVRRPELKFSVLFLDLDRFKVVNDSLGHHAGDQLLKEVALELKRIVRTKDVVARLGGDEFVILIEDLVNNQEAYDIAQRITDYLATPFHIANQAVFIGTSIGLLFNDLRYKNADLMLRDADTAMYHAKDKGKGRYEVFDASMHKKVQNALRLEADIREGITKKEFTPHFQPIVRLCDEEIVGFEALARWQSKQRGFVYPSNFIPLAEETNLIMAIDFQILEKSCRQLKLWQDQLQRYDLYVSCNLFANHFFNYTLPADILKILDKVGLSPNNLRIELTERALLENSHVVLENMTALKSLGIKILLDDFGTGYSSLSYLHRFPIDVLKIDRSFINNVDGHDNHQAIIKTIIDLATSLQMETVGEGLENLTDANLLKKMDCMYGQGFYFYKPMPAHELAQYLQTKKE